MLKQLKIVSISWDLVGIIVNERGLRYTGAAYFTLNIYAHYRFDCDVS